MILFWILNIPMLPKLDNQELPILENHKFPVLDNHGFPVLDNHEFPILDNEDFLITDLWGFVFRFVFSEGSTRLGRCAFVLLPFFMSNALMLL